MEGGIAGWHPESLQGATKHQSPQLRPRHLPRFALGEACLGYSLTQHNDIKDGRATLGMDMWVPYRNGFTAPMKPVTKDACPLGLCEILTVPHGPNSMASELETRVRSMLAQNHSKAITGRASIIAKLWSQIRNTAIVSYNSNDLGHYCRLYNSFHTFGYQP